MQPFFLLCQTRGTPAYRPYLLALLTHQSNWSTLLQCISALLGKRQDYKYTILFDLILQFCQALKFSHRHFAEFFKTW